MAKKFIPNSDQEFATMAMAFARTLAARHGECGISSEDSARLTAAVSAFHNALREARSGGRSVVVTRTKDDCRATAEQMIRRFAHLIRANPNLDEATKFCLHIRPRTEKPKALRCPKEAPELRFVRAHHEGSGAAPMHELSFYANDGSSKPAGAVRVELFVDLIPPDEPVPAHPGATSNSRPWYLRSYTRSPIKLNPPMANVPMRVVYWARWADSVGNVGPFSKTAVGWIEGGTHHLMFPGNLPGKPRAEVMRIEAAAPPAREERYRVALLEVQYQTFTPPALPEPAPQATPLLETADIDQAA